MTRFAKLAAVSVLALSAAGCASLHRQKGACYWMTQDGSQWVSAPEVETKTQCFALDSCSGGQGQSGGGCYKWSKSAAAPAEKW